MARISISLLRANSEIRDIFLRDLPSLPLPGEIDYEVTTRLYADDDPSFDAWKVNSSLTKITIWLKEPVQSSEIIPKILRASPSLKKLSIMAYLTITGLGNYPEMYMCTSNCVTGLRGVGIEERDDSSLDEEEKVPRHRLKMFREGSSIWEKGRMGIYGWNEEHFDLPNAFVDEVRSWFSQNDALQRVTLDFGGYWDSGDSSSEGRGSGGSDSGGSTVIVQEEGLRRRRRVEM